MPTLEVKADMATDPGRHRRQNQDAIGQLVPSDPGVLEQLGQIFVLADGVGGLEGGDLASQYAVSTIISSYYEQEEGAPPERLARAIAEANNVIYAEGHEREGQRVMATTVVAAVVRGDELVIGSVGDSPAYLMREAQPRKLTLDHTLESLRREAGKPLPKGDPSGEKLVRALGSMASVKVDIISGRVRHGDHVILCSDGLTRYVSAQEIESTIATLPIQRTAHTLINLANTRGGSDNVSVIVLRIVDETATERLYETDEALESPEGDALQDHAEPFDDDLLPGRARSRVAQRRAAIEAGMSAEPLAALWDYLRGNRVVAGLTMSVLLVVFVVIMLVVFSAGDDNPNTPAVPPTTAMPAADRTATADQIYAATQRAMAVGTNDAIQAATAAEIARQTLAPPSPVPTGGPMLEDGIWFKVLPGDSIPTYTDPAAQSDSLADLEAGQTYRVTAVDRDAAAGPWYRVIDAFGVQGRWVSGPSLHARITAVDTSGNPLPSDQQPLDVPVPGVERPTPTPRFSPTPLPTMPGTPGTPATALPTPSPTPTIAYGVEAWSGGSAVTMKTALDLCQTPDILHCDAGTVDAGELGSVVSGPVAGGEHWWWEIEFPDGRRGWIAQVLLAAP